MHLIICEKQVAAKRITAIISSDDYKTKKKYKVPYYSFKDHLVVGLSGHVLKVDFPEKYSSWTKVPLKELALAELVYLNDKLRIIKLVKALAKQADDVVIATDFDTEGESIGLEAVNIIKSVKDLPVKRMHYSAITPDEINSSYNNLTALDYNLAFAADTRREIDLIWGAVLTRFLSLSTKRLGNSYLSAGRVQSPTLSLIVEREKERNKFKPLPYWQFPLKIKKDGVVFTARYSKKRVFDKELKDELSGLKPPIAVVKKVGVKERVSKPPTPFNTTSFLREAANLAFSGVNAMRIAESLYLKGFISYPRTDNQVYPKSIDTKKILDSFKGTSYEPLLDFLKKGLKPTRGSKQTRDHPPIHPTGVEPKGLKKDEKRVYDLIVRRFISTFARKCVEEITRVRLDVEGYDFVSRGYRVVSPGWRGVYTFSAKEDNVLPGLAGGDSLKVVSLKCVSKKTKPPRRYGHGTIIKAMNDLNLGTKSTRPAIIQKLVRRHYLFSSKSLEPTPIAMAVMNALDSYANLITEPSMTRELEDDMELIANGEVSKEEVVNKSRELLLKALEVLTKHQEGIAERIWDGIHESRVVGSCLKCGKDMVIITSKRTGKRFIGCEGYPNCHNSYPLPQHGLLRINNTVCSDCGLHKMILIRKGKRPFSFCPNLDCPSRDDD
ncbi:DNA topoisomerase I [archaeon]|nr:DNA topoisomerase I [archaeon]